MTVIASAFAGEKITMRNKSISEALGVLEDWIFQLEVRLDEVAH